MPHESLDAEYEKFARAMFQDSLPCNWKPFQHAWQRYIEAGGDPQSDTSKAIGWMILTLMTGVQLGKIDLLNPGTPWLLGARTVWPDTADLDMAEEWNRLNDVFNTNE